MFLLNFQGHVSNSNAAVLKAYMVTNAKTPAPVGTTASDTMCVILTVKEFVIPDGLGYRSVVFEFGNPTHLVKLPIRVKILSAA